jgi:AraC family transcriptional regulator
MRVMPRGAYFGRSVRSREVAGLILTEKVHPLGERTPPHSHVQPYLCFVLEGAWEERSDSGARWCAPQTLIYHPPGDVHSDHFRDNAGHVFAIEMDHTWHERLDLLADVLQEPRVVESGAPAAVAMRLYDESRRRDSPSALLIEGLMLELLGSLARFRAGIAVSPAPAWLRNTEEILHARFRQPPSIREMAALAEVHPVHLARAFRSRYGCSISEYVCRLRVEAACTAMSTTKRTLSDIAIDVGFFDQSHFTKAFHRIVGTTPARFRAAVTPALAAASRHNAPTRSAVSRPNGN